MLPLLRKAGYKSKKKALEKVERLMIDVKEILKPAEVMEEGFKEPCLLYQKDLLDKFKEGKGWDIDREEGKKAYLRVCINAVKRKNNMMHGKKMERIRERAHRLICFQVHGPPPTRTAVVRHLCSDEGGRCLQGSHLRWGSSKQNALDARALWRQRQDGDAANPPLLSAPPA